MSKTTNFLCAFVALCLVCSVRGSNDAPFQNSSNEDNGWYFENNFGYYYASPEIRGGSSTSGWVYSLWSDWIYVLPRKDNGSFWLWHSELGWCFMGPHLTDYIWVNSEREWIFFVNDDPENAYYFSFAHDKWTSFDEIPVVNFAEFDQFITDLSTGEVEAYQFSPNASGTSGSYSISESLTISGRSATVAFSGSYQIDPPSVTARTASITLSVDNYRIVVSGFGGINFNGTAQQFYNTYGEEIFDTIKFEVSFESKYGGTYSAAASFNGNSFEFENGAFRFE